MLSLKYIAGFFDGEGNINIYESRQRGCRSCPLGRDLSGEVLDHEAPALRAIDA